MKYGDKVRGDKYGQYINGVQLTADVINGRKSWQPKPVQEEKMT